MPINRLTWAGALAGASVAAISVTSALAQQDGAPFGGEEDVSFAQELWNALVDADLAGDDAILVRPYKGTEPHGFQLATIYSQLSLEGRSGQLIVKRNYGPEGVTTDQVINNPDEHLASITVMYAREEGYDSDNRNWFWVKYLPDGSLDKNPAGKQLAGRVAKGADQGCIACHSIAPGGDYEYLRDPK